MYQLIRSIHLLLLAAVQPLSYLYIRQAYPEFFPSLSGFQVFCIIACGAFVSLFYLLFEVRYFPTALNGAFMSMAGMMGNVVAAGTAGSRPFFGAYSVSFRLTLAYSIYFGMMTWFFVDKEKRKKWFHYTDNWYIALVLLFLIVSVLSFFLFSIPYKDELAALGGGWFLVACILGLGADVFFSVKNLYGLNVFQYERDGKREARDKMLENWALATVLLLLASLGAGTLIICWDRL